MKSKIMMIGVVAAAAMLSVAVARAQCGSGPSGHSCCVKRAGGVTGNEVIGHARGIETYPEEIEETAAGQGGLAVQEPLKTVLDNYLQIQRALANDSTKGVAQSASAISKAAAGEGANRLPAKIGGAAKKLEGVQNVKSARQAFKELSDALIQHVGAQKIAGLRVAYCPMVKASWLQTENRLNNPYMGRSMPECGEFKN